KLVGGRDLVVVGGIGEGRVLHHPAVVAVGVREDPDDHTTLHVGGGKVTEVAVDGPLLGSTVDEAAGDRAVGIALEDLEVPGQAGRQRVVQRHVEGGSGTGVPHRDGEARLLTRIDRIGV